MAAPDEMKTTDISGTFFMNKTLSDDTDKVLTLQGLGWFTRKGINLATITLKIKHYKDADGCEHIDIDQTLTGGIKGTTEARQLDGTERDHTDHIFGTVNGHSKRLKRSEIDDKYLSEGWRPEVDEDGLIESFAVNTANDWVARQTWGFEDFNGEKYYVRHLVFTTPKSDPERRIEKKLVYSYVGPLDS